MNKTQQTELLMLNSDFAAIVSEARNAGTIEVHPNTGGVRASADILFQPAELYGRATAKLAGGTFDNANVTAEDITRSIRMTAAKIRAGDRAYIIESMVGKVVWLQAMALRLSDYAAGVSDPRKKAALGHLLLKMEATSTKILASLAAVSCLEPSR